MKTNLRVLVLGVSSLFLLSSCALPPAVAWRVIRQDGFLTYLAIELGKQPPPPGMMHGTARAGSILAHKGNSNVSNPWNAQPNRFWNPSAPSTSYPYSYGSSSLTQRSQVGPPPPRVVIPPPTTTAPTPVLRTNPAVTAPSAPRTYVAATPPPAAPKPTAKVEQKIASGPPSSPAPKPKADAPGSGSAPSPYTPPPTPAPKPPAVVSSAEIPYGEAIAGRPGFVHSPFAAKNQIVDVTGLRAGQEVKCPFSGKLFRVPLGEQASAKPAEEKK